MSTDFMSEIEVMKTLGKGKTALWRLKKNHGFPAPILTHPAKYSRNAVEKWIADGGVNRAV